MCIRDSPKDIGYICMRLGVGPNRTVIEAGTGSGSLTVALSWFSGTTGKVHTFEACLLYTSRCV